MIALQSYDPLHYGVLSSDDLRTYYTTAKGNSQEKTCCLYSHFSDRFGVAELLSWEIFKQKSVFERENVKTLRYDKTPKT